MTADERRLIEYLLQLPFPGRDELRQQLDHVRVCEEYYPDDPSIVLCTDRPPPVRAPVKRRIPVEAEGRDRDGVSIHVLLHSVDWVMSELEIFRDDSGPLLLPAIDDLELFSPDISQGEYSGRA